METVKRFKDMNLEERRAYFSQKQREKRAREKSNDPEGFTSKLREEKKRERAEKKSDDPEGYTSKLREEKERQRAEKKSDDPEGFMSKRRDEKRKERAKVLSEENNRNEIFIKSIKEGRIYECICCHRVMFKNGGNKF